MTRRRTKCLSVQDKRKTNSQTNETITDIYGSRKSRDQKVGGTVRHLNCAVIETNGNQPVEYEGASRAVGYPAIGKREPRRERNTRNNAETVGIGQPRGNGRTHSEVRITRSTSRTANSGTHNGSATDNIASGSPQTDADKAPLVITIPMNFRSGPGRARKRIVGPDGCDFAPAVSPRRSIDSTLVKALARAFRWRKLVESGAYASITDLAKVEKVNQSYACRLLRITLLSPDIITAILDGRADRALQLHDLLKPFPVEWGEQRAGLKPTSRAWANGQ